MQEVPFGDVQTDMQATYLFWHLIAYVELSFLGGASFLLPCLIRTALITTDCEITPVKQA